MFTLRIHAGDNCLSIEQLNSVINVLGMFQSMLTIERDSDQVCRLTVKAEDLAQVIYTLTLYGVNVYHINAVR